MGHASGDLPRAWVRVLVTAITTALAFAAVLALGELPRGWGQVGLAALGLLLLLPPTMIVLLVIVELIAWRMRPVRSGKWLAVSLFLFPLIMLIVPALLITGFEHAGVGVLENSGTASDEPGAVWVVIQFLAVLAAAALTWWSYLPGRRMSLERVFE
ncbi:MAG: hypothetical protein JWO25_2302 [Alphaproteobacteria bacterium]|nr:hypothetical protein [Alphaproteobacteria bacterium]MDB5722292.1 hypothetical protein [Alphaproteobacteria bacterium]